MPTYTTRLSLPSPNGSEAADGPAAFAALNAVLDGVAAQFAQGTAAARPVPESGLLYWATDTKQLSYSDGTGWSEIGDRPALAAQPVLDIGVAGQIRAGRQLTAADFTALGLSPPLGLWNLSDLTDASGNGRLLSDKNTVTFAAGISGVVSTSAQFRGASLSGPANDPALYIADDGTGTLPGAAFRIKTGSWGCWFKTAKRATDQRMMSRWASTGGQGAFLLGVNINPPNTGNAAYALISIDGTATPQVTGVSDVADDRWHFGVVTYDGTVLRLYVDSVLEGTTVVGGPIFPAVAPLNIGGMFADFGTNVALPFYGRVDEAFVTADVLSEEQIRSLYCAKIPHTLGLVPTRAMLSVRRRRRGGTLAVADFPAQPVRLHNFTAGSLADEGSGGVALANATPTLIVPVGGADGATGNAFSFTGAHAGLSAADTGLPSVLAPRSYGCWFKTAVATGGNFGIVSWGTAGTRNILFISNGQLAAVSASDQITGPFAADGQWHHVVIFEDNTGQPDLVKRKLYLDGRLVGGSTVMGSFTLGGASRFRVGADVDGTLPFAGQIDGAFVYAGALKEREIAALYAKGSQPLAASPKSAGDHVEGWDAAAVYATFDTLESSAQIDLRVTA